MPDEIDQLRTFRADAPAPSAAAWTHAEQAIARARRRGTLRRFSGRRVLAPALAAAAVLAAAVLVPLALRALPTVSAGPAATRVATGWHLNTHGPVRGTLTCPTATTTCYDQAATSRNVGAIVSETIDRLYVSADGTRTWRAIALPSGLTFTSAMVCQTATTCSAGAEDHGKPAFTVTRDGGRTWTTNPLPSSAGAIAALTCPAATTCRGLAITPEQTRKLVDRGLERSATTQLLVTTGDGRHFTVTAFPKAEHIDLLSCPTASDCVAGGVTPAPKGPPAGIMLTSHDGGVTWQTGALPRRVQPARSLDCVDARHCFDVGLRLQTDHSELLVSTDGGATWQGRPLPARYPHPNIFALACVSPGTCYITGEQNRHEKFDNGKATSAGRAFAAVTQDAGLTWRPMSFPEPSSIPRPKPPRFAESPDDYMLMVSLQCPRDDTCIGLTLGVQDSKYGAIYTATP
jgi:photosystem II stability/assembly factor-like uncharacterized protein